jgi:hypothetical protein
MLRPSAGLTCGTGTPEKLPRAHPKQADSAIGETLQGLELIGYSQFMYLMVGRQPAAVGSWQQGFAHNAKSYAVGDNAVIQLKNKGTDN